MTRDEILVKLSIKKRRDDIRMMYVFHNFVLQFQMIRTSDKERVRRKPSTGINSATHSFFSILRFRTVYIAKLNDG